MECVAESPSPIRRYDALDDLTLVQLTAGRQRSSHTAVSCGGVRLHRRQFERGGLLRGNHRQGRLILGWFDERSTAATVAGKNLGSNHLFAFVDTGMEICTLGGARLSWLELDYADFAAQLSHTRLSVPGASVAVRDVALLQPLRARFDGAIDADGLVGAGIESDVRRLLESIAASVDCAGQAYRYTAMRAAEEFMWQHVDEPMSIGRIAAAFSRSERTVVSLFQSAFGLGPISYFKAQRLNAVRRELARAPRGRKIIDIAADYSFWHMGHFSADYRRLFGETPSETRRPSYA